MDDITAKHCKLIKELVEVLLEPDEKVGPKTKRLIVARIKSSVSEIEGDYHV